MTGNVLAQIISVAATPVITRLFTPENFGLLAIYAAIVGILSKAGSLCYERAIVLPKKTEESINILFLSFIILLLVSFATCFVVFFLNDTIAHFFDIPEFSFWVLFTPLGVLLTGTVNIFRYWRLRNNEFKSIAFSRISESTVSGVTKILIGFWIGSTSGGLISSVILGTFVASILLVFKPTPFNFKKHLHDISKRSIDTVAKTYKKFPYFASPNALLNVFSQQFIIFLFAILFSPAVVGFYTLGHRLLKQPITLLSESVQNAYFHKSAQQINNKVDLIPGFKKTMLALIASGIIPFAILAFFSPKLFGIIFGENWETAGLYVQIMAPWFFFIYISSPSNVIYEVCQKQDLKLFLNISAAVMRFSALLAGYAFSKNPITIIAFFVIVNVIFEAITIICAFVTAKRFRRIR